MQVSYAMPKTGLSPREIREKAIASTLKRMRRHGFEKVSLVDVAADLGLSHAALYSYFADKAALLDAVSERWLNSMDSELEKIVQQDRDPLVKIHDWFLKLHRLKREKVRHDPELFKSFNLASEARKPFVIAHMENMRRQMTALVKEAMAAGKIRKGSAEKASEILREVMVGFSHPKLVVQYLEENREPLLKQTLETVLNGLR
ncbi:MAG TPA: TetR/AcrR family transcriptional regulator [Candidatus Acidoferrales bacterium]|jgi:AcrR family transcriptional regulator|nr:TetR/AcrR family transcriptional regulator [Candidatus Acidoferrales bacterium]